MKVSKAQAAFTASFVGPKINGTQRARAMRLAFREYFVGPPAPLNPNHWRQVKKFWAGFVGPKLPVGTREYQRVHSKKHYRNHKSESHAKAKERKARQRDRIPAWFGEFDRFVFEEAYSLLPVRKAATGIDWHVDHMLPMRSRKVSGLHVGVNAAVIPAELNLKKGNRLILTNTGDWLRL